MVVNSDDTFHRSANVRHNTSFRKLNQKSQISSVHYSASDVNSIQMIEKPMYEKNAVRWSKQNAKNSAGSQCSISRYSHNRSQIMDAEMQINYNPNELETYSEGTNELGLKRYNSLSKVSKANSTKQFFKDSSKSLHLTGSKRKIKHKDPSAFNQRKQVGE